MTTPSSSPIIDQDPPDGQVPSEPYAEPEDAPPTDAQIYDRLCHPFEVTFVDPRGFTYITGEQVIRRLNQVLGVGGWSFKVLTEKYEPDSDEVVVLGELVAEIDGKIVVRQQYGSQKHNRNKPLCGVVDTESGEVCGDFQNDHDRRHGGEAGHRFSPGPRGPILDSGFDHMGAATTALKKCATYIGVGLYLSAKIANPDGTARTAQTGAAAKTQTTRQRPATQPATSSQGASRASSPPANVTDIRRASSNGAASAAARSSGPSDAPAGSPEAKAYVCADCGKPLEPQPLEKGGEWSIEDLAANSMHFFQRVLCGDDYRKAAAERVKASKQTAEGTS